MYYIYMIDDLFNKKKYVGQRKCPINETPESDKYMGSGIDIKKSIKKYGKEYFKKSILCTCSNQNVANELEAYFIFKNNAVDSEDFYNKTDAPILRNVMAVSRKAKNAESINVVSDFIYRYDYDWPDIQCYEFYRDILKTETDPEIARKKINYIHRTFNSAFGHTFPKDIFSSQIVSMRADAPKVFYEQSDLGWLSCLLANMKVQ